MEITAVEKQMVNVEINLRMQRLPCQSIMHHGFSGELDNRAIHPDSNSPEKERRS